MYSIYHGVRCENFQVKENIGQVWKPSLNIASKMGDLYNKSGKLIIKGNPNIDWKTWKKCFENYLVASGMDGVKDERKIAITINLIGEDGQQMYDNFKYEAGEDKKKFDVVM